jgi:adenylosuccinate lyase
LKRLGLGVPATPWLTARDRIAEFTGLLALTTGTLARIGNEVYNLQRPEIGELAEAPSEGVVGSITMPQKRNPERSEHLVTLSRVVRAGAALAFEGLVGEHERDGAAWKTEWAFLPEACSAAAVSLALGADLLDGLQVDAARMRANVEAQGGYVDAERVMLELAQRVGKHRAHEIVHRAALAGQQEGLTFAEALRRYGP